MNRSIEKIPRLRARGRENRIRLLREAHTLMLEMAPGDSLKFSDVFEAAGVSRGSAYRIYDGIDDLFQDIATEWVNNFVCYLRSSDPDAQPENWAELSDFILLRATEYWLATADTVRLLPRLRSDLPGGYRLAVQAMSEVLVDIFARFFVMPDTPEWSRKLGFYTELCDLSFADAIRTEGHISEKRRVEAEMLGRTYLASHLPADLPARQKAS